MRNIRLALAVAIVVAATAPSSEARAEGGPFGAGLIVGSPTGVSLKLYLNRTNAIDAAIGGALLGASGIHIHADYLWHPLMLSRDDSFFLPLYIGLGGRVLQHRRSAGRDDDFHLGVRGVAGILFDFRRVPIDVFVEGAIVIDVVVDDFDQEDHGRFGINAGMGVRYYF